MFEFTFNFENSSPLYITHETNQLDNELLEFLDQIGVNMNEVTDWVCDKI